MKMEATYNEKNDRLNLTYDLEAQRTIYEAASSISDIKAKESNLDELEWDPQSRSDFLQGTQILGRLGKSRSLRVTTTGYEAGLALFAVCMSTFYLLHKKKSVDHVGPVIALLAGVTPLAIPVPCSSLPPSAKVFDSHAVSVATRQVYELLRVTGQLSVLQAHQLRKELQHLSKLSGELMDLIKLLEVLTVLFCSATKAIARAEIASGKQKPKKK